MQKKQVYILLHDIRSVYNVGAIFRTADAIGVSKIYLSGYSPTPNDRFGRPRKDFAKCALGSEKTVAWMFIENPKKLIEEMKIDGFQIISIEQTKNSIDYKNIVPNKKSLVIFGNEVEGVNQEFLKISDAVLEIPMNGKKESLNVSVSAGIVLFRLFDQ